MLRDRELNFGTKIFLCNHVYVCITIFENPFFRPFHAENAHSRNFFYRLRFFRSGNTITTVLKGIIAIFKFIDTFQVK